MFKELKGPLSAWELAIIFFLIVVVGALVWIEFGQGICRLFTRG